MSANDDPHLFQPTLNAADDHVGFGRPWSPNGVVIAALFFGPIAGGLMMALNFKRLGQPERLWSTLLAFAGLTLALGAIFASFYDPGQSRSTLPRGVRFLGNVLTVALAYLLARRQEKRFRIHQLSDGETGKWLLPILLSLFVGGPAYLVVLALVNFMVNGIPS